MRFAYIDSQGNEVQIPSVEGLALRIELGAIGPDTELYDEAADRWGPAHTHEIFHTLTRAMEEEGFVAPPPPAAPERESAPEEPAEVGEDVGASGDSEEAASAESDEAASAESNEAASAESNEAASAESDEVASVSAESEEGASLETEDGASGESGEADSGQWEVEPEASGGATEDEAPSEPPTPVLDLSADLGLTLTEPGPSDEEESEREEAFDFSFEHSPFGEPEAGSPPAEEEPTESAAFDFGAMGGLDLEKPMSEFTPEAPPAWMEQEGPQRGEGPDDEGIMDLSRPDETPVHVPERAGGGEDRVDYRDRLPRERPVPRSRPSPPKPLRKPFPLGALVGVLILLGIAAGGWYGWSLYQRRQATERAALRAASLPAVTIPTIPPGLVGTMRRLGNEALSGTIEELRTEEAAFALPAEPDNAWLGGAYLANASRYPDVERYWVLIDSFVDHVRKTDTRVFHDQYVRQLDRAGIKGDTASMLLARADSGFLATRAARFEAYKEMSDLTNAALDLHEFLLRHEAEITYAPAAGGVSKDPVLEAVPRTQELGKQMWGMVDRITEALNVLGTLDKVTTKRLSGALFEKIRAAGFK